jgi:hypothetical protein
MKSSTLTIGIAAALAVASAASSRSGSPNQGYEAQATENLLRFIRDHAEDPVSRFGVLQLALLGAGAGERSADVHVYKDDLRDALAAIGEPTSGNPVTRYTNLVKKTLEKEGIWGLGKIVPGMAPGESDYTPPSQRPAWRAAWVKTIASKPDLLEQLYEVARGLDWEQHGLHASTSLPPRARAHRVAISNARFKVEQVALGFFHDAKRRR